MTRAAAATRATSAAALTSRFLARRGELLAAGGVLALACAIRSYFVLPASFPLNDGGLFYAMAADIRAAGYALPDVTSYGDGSIPFAYSPLALYLAALLDRITPLDLLDVFRVAPLLGSLVSVGAFYLLARSLLGGRIAPLAATAAFAVVPRSYTWLIMGGGLPRGLALAFALLALWQLHLALRSPRRIHTGAAATAAALTVLTHLETAVLLAATMPLLLLARWSWPGMARATVVGAGALLGSAPWWALILARHGIEPFLSAMDHGGWLLDNGSLPPDFWDRLLDPVYTGETYFPAVGALGVLGAAYSLARGRWMLPVWWLLIMALDMRAFMTFAAVPTAMLAGVAVADVFAPALRTTPEAENRARRFVGPVLVAALVVGVAAGSAVDGTRGELTLLDPLEEPDRSAMRWVAEQTPEAARFLVLPRNGWYGDRHGEWFPALAGRESVATPQGYEWVRDAFGRRQRNHQYARACTAHGASCIEPLWERTRFTHVFVPSGCCDELRSSIIASERYHVLYDRNGVTVAARR